MRRSARAQQILFRIPPYDTPRAARCNKDKFRVHRRHAAAGVCEQRITALRNYIRRKCSDDSVLSKALLMSAMLKTESWATEVRSCPWPQCVKVVPQDKQHSWHTTLSIIYIDDRELGN